MIEQIYPRNKAINFSRCKISLINLERETKIAFKAVTTAAMITRKLLQYQAKEIVIKNDNSPVTVADYCSQAVICKTIHNSFPSINDKWKD